MPLSAEFQDFISPQSLRDNVAWQELLPLSGNTAYQKRFFVHGLRNAAQSLGVQSAKAMWDVLAGVGKKSARETAANRQKDHQALQEILAALPAQWKIDIPDINDRGEAKSHTTYWREYAKNQLLNTWETKPQSLPKALLSLATLYLVAEHVGTTWEDLSAQSPVCIKPSVFWLVDYTDEVYDRAVAASLTTTREAYKACGLDFDLGPNQRSDALQKAAAGATLTYDTAARLETWLRRRGVACGPILVVPRDHKTGPAAEMFTRT